MFPTLSIMRMNRRRRIEEERSPVRKTFPVHIAGVPAKGFVDLKDIRELEKFLPAKRIVILNNSTDAETIAYVKLNNHEANVETSDTYSIRALGVVDLPNAYVSNFGWSVSRLDGAELSTPFTLNVTVYSH